MSTRRIAFYLFFAFLVVLVIGIPIRSQFVQTQQGNTHLIVGRNVNMVSGTKLPGGDPYLQRQNEPSIAVSTRNAMHLLAGSNDYRTIDLPFEDLVPGYEYGNATDVRDAWVSVYQSRDGGQSWTSTLLPGFPQDISPEGLFSPLKAFGTAADPVVKAGTNGIFYYAGIAFNRVDRGSGVVFVARFIDLNNQENEDTIKYDGVSIIGQGNAGQFLDKPWIAVDIPRSGSSQAVLSNQAVSAGQAEPVPCGSVYIAYSAFVGQSNINVRSKILFAVSTDCCRTWSTPIKLSESQHIDQGATISIDPITGAIYVAWRRFTHPSQPSAILIAKSIDKGKTFTKAVVVRNLALSFPPSSYGPFDQRTEALSFRTNSYPTMTVDHNGVVYLAWSERNLAQRSLVYMTYSKDGINWPTPPIPIDSTGTGHQFMPSLTYAAGKLMLTWYDQRRDINLLECNWVNPGFVEDNPCRHNIDVRVAEIDPVVLNSSGLGLHTSKQVSRYLCTYETENNGDPIIDIDGYINLIQLQYNFPNLRLFQKGTVPFLGDYIEITPAPRFLAKGNSWVYNTDPSQEAVFHVAWTDNRDVREGDPSGYFAPTSDQSGSPFPDGQCNNSGNTGVLNQNVYTACISQGFVAGSPGNAKPLDLENNPIDTNGHPIPRAFTVFVKNMTDGDRSYTLEILAPQGVEASFFEYFDVPEGQTFPVDYLFVEVAAHSSISRSVFVYPYADNPQATVKVLVTEVDTSLASTVLLNPDPTNPIIGDPYDGYQGPNIRGKEVHSPNIRGVSVKNTTNKTLLNPNIRGEDIVNSDSANPNIRGNPLNPNIRGTDVESPNIRGESISEITWEVENAGNTTTPYNFYSSTEYERPDGISLEEAMQFQLLIYRVYYTPVAEGCTLGEEEHHELITNIPGPNIRGTSIPDEAIENATFYLKPGEKALIKLLAIDPVPGNNDDFDFGSIEEPNTEAAVISLATNTEDLQNGIYTPPVSGTTELKIMTSSLDDATLGVPYSQTLNAFGENPPFTWSIYSGALPPGLVLNPNTGEISGMPEYNEAESYPATYDFTVRVTDNKGNFVDKTFSIFVAAPPLLIDCADGTGGDFIDRGFYIPNYAGSSIDLVVLYIGEANIQGNHTIRLTAYLDAYDGQVIGTSTTTALLSSSGHDPVSFYFQGAQVQPGSRVAFKMELISSPPGTSWIPYFVVSTCGLNNPNCPTNCPIIETDDTTPPLSVFRRNGIKAKIFGQS